MYTIGQVSEMFSLPISTLRYYDKEELFPGMERQSGIRKFSERELEALRVTMYDMSISKTSQGYLFQMLHNEKNILVEYRKKLV